MRKMREVHWSRRAVMGILSLAIAITIAIVVDGFSIVSHAQSQAKVTAESANIRQTTSTSSQVVASVVRNDELTISGQTTGADGYTRYQVFVDANTMGYIRSDLVQITSGGTPPALSNTTTNNNTTTTTNNNASTPPATYNPTVEVTDVNPVSATVKGGQAIRVRADASTSSGIVTTAQSGTALTVTGQATGTDNKVWYRVTFTVNGSEVTGFIRSDYVNLSEDVTPATESQEPNQAEEPGQTAEPEIQTKDWETRLEGEEWYLINNVKGEQWKVKDVFYAADTNKNLAEQQAGTIKNLKIIIIVLVVVILILAVALTMVIFKMKDVTDSAYFAEVEKETMRRRPPARTQKSGQKPVRPQGAGDRRPSAQGSRPASDGRRPAQAGARPAQSAQSSRPTQASRTIQSPNAQRPDEGARPAQSSQGSRPAQGEARPAQSTQRPVREGVRPASAQPKEERRTQPSSDSASKQPWKSKNFMADDEDEFEFEYLNWDGDEEP